MKNVSSKFKKAIKQMGRQLDLIITYTENGQTKYLYMDDLFSVDFITRGNLLKSVMKQLNFESYTAIPKGTIINVTFGVLIETGLTVKEVHEMKVNRLNTTIVKDLSTLKGFEYINLGNYIVSEEPEYNADTLSYSHICYDKMLYSMVDYESLNVTYPITIKNYLTALATKIGLTLKESTFYNENKTILDELYLDADGNSLGYTFRDVLDEIAQATGSIICISNDDKLEIRYLNEINETIDGDMLKDVNVEFKELYGTINLVVLSRSAGTDNIYYPEILPQNPVELKIADNQILNFNNRDEYIQGIYNAVNGINYYINDFKSTGICYLELGDKYNVEIDGTTYNCVLLNDEINITQGLEEQIYTEMPEQGETDYTKADKTDRRINQTTLIVDKQNQRIEGIISQIGDRSQKTTTITADIDGLNSRVEDIEDLTNEVSGTTTITLENCIQGSLLELHIYGNNTVFDSLYPADDLYPANDLYPYGDSRIEVQNYISTSQEPQFTKIYELGVTKVLRQNGDVKDEYILKEGNAKIIRRINEDGTIKANETIEDLGEFYIDLGEDTNIITIKNYTAQLKAKYAIKSDYTEVFATRIEMNSSITQTAQEINLEVNKKVDNDEIISRINQSAEQIQINADKIDIDGKAIHFKTNIEESIGPFTATDLNKMIAYLEGTGTLTPEEFAKYDIDGRGTIDSLDLYWVQKAIINGGYYFFSGYYEIDPYSSKNSLRIYDNFTNSFKVIFSLMYNYIEHLYAKQIEIETPNGIMYTQDSSNGLDLYIRGNITATGQITCDTLIQTSKQEEKKNFEKFNNALEILKNIDIYKYNLKSEKNNTKKHIGFVIGKDFKHSEEVTSKNDDGVDIYSFVSLCCKAIQEQQEQIEQLKQEISELKGGK